MDATAFRVVRHTRNFDQMLRFYQDSLGMTCAYGWDRPGNRGALLSPGEKMGDSAIEVLDLEELAVPDTPPANLELSIEVQGVAEWHDRLAGIGVPIVRGLEDTPWGHHRSALTTPTASASGYTRRSRPTSSAWGVSAGEPIGMIVYLNDRFIPKDEARISPDDRGFLLADGAYEVIRAYGGRFFKTQKHLARLERSLQELRIAAPDTQSLAEVAAQLLQHNRLQDADALLYIQVTRGVAARRHSFPDPGTRPTVYACAFPFRQSREKWEGGVKAILVPDIRWARCDIKSVALLPNVLASQQASEQGADEALFVRDGVVTEGAHTNFCAVLDGQLVTHPPTHRILAGVTRQVVLNLCRALDIPVRETPVLEWQLREASELMITSTTAEVTPVVQLDDWRVADGAPGPITTRLQKAFRELVSAETRDTDSFA